MSFLNNKHITSNGQNKTLSLWNKKKKKMCQVNTAIGPLNRKFVILLNKLNGIFLLFLFVSFSFLCVESQNDLTVDSKPFFYLSVLISVMEKSCKLKRVTCFTNEYINKFLKFYFLSYC